MAEYMIVKNNVVTDIFCGTPDDDETDIVILPSNHQVQVGDSLDFYQDGYIRKSEAELIKAGLLKCPEGYIVDNNTLRLMTRDERLLAGLDPLPYFLKISDGKIIHKTEDELWNEKSTDEKASVIRDKRNQLIQDADTLLLKY